MAAEPDAGDVMVGLLGAAGIGLIKMEADEGDGELTLFFTAVMVNV